MLGPEEVTEVLVNGVETVPEEIQFMYGIIPRATLQMFEIINEGITRGVEYSIKCSYIEIYNEMVNDILCNPVGANLKLREFPKLGMCVIGMTERFITSPEEVFECLSAGTANRIVCSTGQNARSSRSHTVFVVVIEQKLQDGSSKISKLNLVDLAGSEKLSKTGATGQSLKEAQNINLSLTTLGRCIKALTSSKEAHVPFRESKLTLILKESLGGNAKTSLLCTASGKLIHKEETLGTFAFAERAKQIKNKATSNVTRSAEELLQMVEQLKQEVSTLRKQLKSRTDNPELALAEGEAEETADDEMRFRFSELQVQHERLQESSVKEIERLQSELERTAGRTGDPLQVRELEDEIIELREGKKQLENTADEVRLKLQAQIDDLTVGMQDNASILFNYQEELMELDDKLTQAKDSLLEREADLKQAQESKEILDKDLTDKQEQLRRLQGELGSLSEQSEALELSVTDLKQQVKTKDQQLSEVQDRLLTVEGELSLLRLEETRQRDLIQQLLQDKAAYELKVEEYKAQLEEVRGELAVVSKKWQVLESSAASERLRLQGELEEQAQELAGARSKAKALEIELKENKLSHEQLEEREALISQLKETHEAQLRSHQTEQEQVRSRHEEALKALTLRIEAEVAAFEAYREKTDFERLEVSLKTEALEVAQQATAHQNIELEYSVKKSQQELATAHSHNAALTNSLKEQKDEYDALARANRDLMMKHAFTLQTSKAFSNSHAKKLEETYKELADARALVGAVELNSQKELSAAHEEADKLRGELKHLKQQLSMKDSTLEEQRKKSADLERTLASADLRLKQMTEDNLAAALKASAPQPSQPQNRISRRGSISAKINTSTAFGGVKLRSTGSKFLKAAIEESRIAQELTPESQYKVYYGYDDIKSALYANTEEIEQEAIANAMQEESKG
jgi:kinesin family protein 5